MDSRERIELFVDYFYSSLLQDEQLAPIFVDTAQIDLSVHLPHIKNYWCKLLLGDKGYQRHTNHHDNRQKRDTVIPACFAVSLQNNSSTHTTANTSAMTISTSITHPLISCSPATGRSGRNTR